MERLVTVCLDCHLMYQTVKLRLHGAFANIWEEEEEEARG